MNEEIIIGIEECKQVHDSWVHSREAGFKITTTAQEILLLIDDDQSCCETWGYFLTEDDTDKFLGETLLGIEVVDTNRSTRVVFARDEDGYDTKPVYDENGDPMDVTHLDAGDTMFVDIQTTRGVLQFVAYNSHNGYYGHQARIISAQLTAEKSL